MQFFSITYRTRLYITRVFLFLFSYHIDICMSEIDVGVRLRMNEVTRVAYDRGLNSAHRVSNGTTRLPGAEPFGIHARDISRD